MARKPRKPSNFTMDPVTAYARRGPKDGRWYWQAIRREAGKQITVWTGWATRDDARRTLAALVAEAGIPQASAARSTASMSTIRELLEYWLGAQEVRQDLSPYSFRNRRTACRRVAEILGDIDLTRLDLACLEQYRDTRMRLKSAPATVQKDIKILRQAWGWARRHGDVADRSLPSLRLNAQPVRAKYTPTPAEVAAVLGHLKTWPRLAVVIMAGTGARIGEVAELTWDRVDLGNAELTFTGKTGSRTVPILPALVAELRTWPRVEGASTILGVSPHSVRAVGGKYLAGACKAAGVTHFSPHALRRLAVDRYYSAGVDVGVVAALLGQSPDTALRHYRAPRRDSKRAALEAVQLGLQPGGKVYPFKGA
jgi:integrase